VSHPLLTQRRKGFEEENMGEKNIKGKETTAHLHFPFPPSSIPHILFLSYVKMPAAMGYNHTYTTAGLLL
jgi:hypothetical protein